MRDRGKEWVRGGKRDAGRTRDGQKEGERLRENKRGRGRMREEDVPPPHFETVCRRLLEAQSV